MGSVLFPNFSGKFLRNGHLSETVGWHDVSFKEVCLTWGRRRVSRQRHDGVVALSLLSAERRAGRPGGCRGAGGHVAAGARRLAPRAAPLPPPRGSVSPLSGVALCAGVFHVPEPERRVSDLCNRPFMTFDNPALCIFPSCISISAKSTSAASDPCRCRRLLPRLFMLSFWCGEYLCCTDDNRIICAIESSGYF